MAEAQVFHRRVTVNTEHGLHIRPCTLLAQLAMKYQSRIWVMNGSNKVDAKSILELMTLGAASGTVLDLEVEGADAAEAVEQVCALFDANFHVEPMRSTPTAVAG